jgi:hypothetical protein
MIWAFVDFKDSIKNSISFSIGTRACVCCVFIVIISQDFLYVQLELDATVRDN